MRSRRDLPHSALGVSAAVFGAATWWIAHNIIWALFAHSHSLGPAHLHAGSVSVFSTVLTLAAALLLVPYAAPVLSNPRSARRGPSMSISVLFVGAELVEHIARDDLAGAPVAVLALVVAAQAGCGAASGLLWTRCLQATHHIVALLLGFDLAGAHHPVRLVVLGCAKVVGRRGCGTGSRGPPARSGQLRSQPI